MGERGLVIKARPNPSVPGDSAAWGIWIIWGFACMGLAHTEMVNWLWFAGFRELMKMIVPSVNYIPPADAIDPAISSSFLALIWGSSPIAWFLFWRLPPERLMVAKFWLAPLATRSKWVMFILVACAVAAFWADFGSGQLANLLMARDEFRFPILASLVTALPWYAVAVVTNWFKRISGLSANQEGTKS